MKIEDFIFAGGRVEIGRLYSALSVPVNVKGTRSTIKLPTYYFFSNNHDEVEILEYYTEALFKIMTKKPASQLESEAEFGTRKANEALRAFETVLKKFKEKWNETC